MALCMLLLACTEQQRARGLGGTSRIELAGGAKLVNVTWKQADLWILTRRMREGEKAETYWFQESSTWGLLEGKVVIVEAEP